MEKIEELKQLVRDEATKLRETATEEERDNLSFKNLQVYNSYACIYGQMTGDCHSPRAIALMSQCAVPYSSGVGLHEFHVEVFDEDERQGKSFEVRLDEGEACDEYNWVFSPIEVYITLPESKNKNLIDFLKGKTNELEL